MSSPNSDIEEKSHLNCMNIKFRAVVMSVTLSMAALAQHSPSPRVPRRAVDRAIEVRNSEEIADSRATGNPNTDQGLDRSVRGRVATCFPPLPRLGRR